MHLVAPLPVMAANVLYGLCMLFLASFGVYQGIFAYIRFFRRKPNLPAPLPPEDWPRVTVQLPIYNEGYMIERLLASVTALDYPRDRLEIQFLDDSTDETSQLAKRLIKRYREQGIDVRYLHRSERQGYKAGNLAFGLSQATGQFIAVLDADFTVDPDWLKRLVPWFADPQVGFVQSRWVHRNVEENLITRGLNVTMAGDHIVVQPARFQGGFLTTFLGSGGIWRKQCLEQSGGWQWDTLLEDLDMSIRAQLGGWRGIYLTDPVVYALLPYKVNTFKTQQYRWAKGGSQVFVKLAPKILTARLPLGLRLEAFWHSMMYLPVIAVLLTLLLTLPIGYWNHSVLTMFPWAVVASIGPTLVYAFGAIQSMDGWGNRITGLLVTSVLSLGISLNNAMGAISGLFTRGGVFETTEKGTEVSPQRAKKASRLKILLLGLGDIFLSAYLAVTLIVLWSTIWKLVAPWLLTATAGFFVTGLWSFSELLGINPLTKSGPVRLTGNSVPES